MRWLAVAILSCAGRLVAATPAINFTTYLGVPNASAAVIDPAANIYAVAGANLMKIGLDGTLLALSTPIAGATLSALVLDAQGRVVVAGSQADGSGFVARPPDFFTPVTGQIVQLAIDPNGNIWAAASTVGHGLDASLIELDPDGTVIATTAVGGASDDVPTDLAIDAAGSVYLSLVSNSAELPSSGVEPLLNGVPGAITYDGGNYFYPAYGMTSAINQWLLVDSNTLYVATQGQGVFHSADRGQTFDNRSIGLPDLAVNMLVVDPSNSQTLYVATAQGLAKTVNGGATWTVLNLTSGPVAAVAVDGKRQLYAALAAPACGSYLSIDAGVTWKQQASSCVVQFLADPNGGVYAATGSALPGVNSIAADASSNWFASATGGIYKSVDKGANWVLSNPGSFTAVAAGAPYIVAGTSTGAIFTSTDAGASWNAAPSAAFSQPVRSLLSDSGEIFVGASYNSGVWLGKFSGFDRQLLASTFLGGSGSETNARIAIDGQSTVTIAMETSSTDIPTTIDAAQRRSGGGVDLAITRLTPGFQLQYGSYFGGSGDERVGSIKLDAQGFLYVAGTTNSQDLPISPNALAARNQGGADAFAEVFNPSANGVVYASYFGGAGDDQGIALLPDNRGNAILLGRSAAAPDSFVVSMSGLIGYQALGATVNSASLQAGPLAPGSLATISGAFGPLSNISVTFNGILATVVQSRAMSMDVAVPDGLPARQQAAIVIVSSSGLSQGTAPIANVAPGLFSANANGQGIALATLIRVRADGSSDNEPVFQCSDTCVALPIDYSDPTDTLYLQMTATGLRNETDLTQFAVAVGGQPAPVLSVQSQGISPGLDQLTIQLPVPPDGFVGPLQWSIQVTVDGVASNSVLVVIE